MTRLHRVSHLVAVQGIIAAALALAGPLLAAGDGGAPAAPPSTPESVRAGEAVFFEYCAGCHGRRADGRGPESLNLDPRPQNLRNAQFVRHLTDERLYTSISGGVRGTAMPAWELELAAAKRWNVIHYIRSLTADDTITVPNGIAFQSVDPAAMNPLPADEANAAAGKRIFLNYPRNLVAVTSWGERPFISYLADARVYDSITNGVPGTSMQPWLGVLTDAERWQAICFLRHEGDRELKARSGSGE